MTVTRRQALATMGLGAAALAGGGGLAAGCGALGRRPNVILLVADDLGSTDVRCFGSPDLLTPHLDRLAGQGLRFSQFYVTAPACTPSRVSLLTGRHYPRALLLGQGLKADETTIAEMLRAVGYRTALFGKWHAGFDEGMRPLDQGFDEFVGHHTGAMDNYSHYFYWGGAERHVLRRGESKYYEPGTYFPDIVTREARRFIEDNAAEPFFLYVPFNIPHYPMQPDPDCLERYSHIRDPARRNYAALVSTLDDRVGSILAKLDDLGLRDDTIVMFLSDHGHSTEPRSGGGGNAGGLRGQKMTLWEGGIRVPFILSWPGRFTGGGELRPQPATSMDILPTLADLCGAPLPDTIIDGASLAGVCASASAGPPNEVLHWLYKENWAVREGPWKLIGQDDEVLLANLASDPGETIDHRDSHPSVEQRLVGLHNRFILELGKDPNVAAQSPGATG